MIWNKKPFAWEQRTYGDIGQCFSGGNLSYDSLSSEGKNKCVLYGELYTTYDCIIKDVVNRTDFVGNTIYKNDILFPQSTTVDADSLISPACLNDERAETSGVFVIRPKENIDGNFVCYYSKGNSKQRAKLAKKAQGLTIVHLYYQSIKDEEIFIPSHIEQEKISKLFASLDSLVALHQRKQKGEKMFKKNNRKKELFWEYYEDWVKVYKEGAVRNVTLRKYHLTLSWLKRIIPDLRIKDLTRVEYQELINRFAECHEKQTTMDFHHHLNAAIEDAIDEGLIEKNPTRKAIIKGKTPRPKKPKYLNQYELHSLLGKLELKDKPSMDWLVLLIAKTGIRFSEAIAVTPADFDFVHQTLTINKTWDYKENGGFQPTKNKSSIRKIQIDWMVVSQFSNLIKDLHPEKPIFVTKEKIYNSTANDLLEKRCKQAGVPVISIHGLRHTHASILLFAGVSVASVAKRLGHSTMTTTEKVYLHIIQELENKDIDLVMRSLSGLI